MTTCLVVESTLLFFNKKCGSKFEIILFNPEHIMKSLYVNKISYLWWTFELQKYLEILRTVMNDFLDNLPLEQHPTCPFQLDGAPPHCNGEGITKLIEMFDDRWFRWLGPWTALRDHPTSRHLLTCGVIWKGRYAHEYSINKNNQVHWSAKCHWDNKGHKIIY